MKYTVPLQHTGDVYHGGSHRSKGGETPIVLTGRCWACGNESKRMFCNHTCADAYAENRANHLVAMDFSYIVRGAFKMNRPQKTDAAYREARKQAAMRSYWRRRGIQVE